MYKGNFDPFIDLYSKICKHKNEKAPPHDFIALRLNFLQPYIMCFFFASNCINHNLIISKITFNIEEEPSPKIIFRRG